MHTSRKIERPGRTKFHKDVDYDAKPPRFVRQKHRDDWNEHQQQFNEEDYDYEEDEYGIK